MIGEKFSFLKEAALQLGSPQLRNRATIVGNICTASPCADMARALLCLDTSVHITSSEKKRTLPLKDFFVHVKKTALEPGEFVTGLTVPAKMAGISGGHHKLKRIKGHDLAVASVSMVYNKEFVRFAVGSCAITPALFEFAAGTSLEDILQQIDKNICPIDDQRASGEYRRHMVACYVKKLFQQMS